MSVALRVLGKLDTRGEETEGSGKQRPVIPLKLGSHHDHEQKGTSNESFHSQNFRPPKSQLIHITTAPTRHPNKSSNKCEDEANCRRKLSPPSLTASSVQCLLLIERSRMLTRG